MGVASVGWGGSTGGMSLIVEGGLSLIVVGGLSFIVVCTSCASELVWGRASFKSLAVAACRARANAGLYIQTPSMLTCQSSGWLLIEEELDDAVLVSLFKNLLTPVPLSLGAAGIAYILTPSRAPRLPRFPNTPASLQDVLNFF